MKKHIVGLSIAALMLVAMPVAAEEATVAELKAEVSVLQELVAALTQLQFLAMALPAAEYDDEGELTVLVNDNLRFACEGKSGTDGQWCVRHSGSLGESYVDLALVPGFTHHDMYEYELTLLKLRAETYGTDGEPQYDYILVSINELTAE